MTIIYIPADARLVNYPVLLIAVSSISSSTIGFVDRIIYLTWSICPFNVTTLLWRYLFTSWTESPDHDQKYPFLIAMIHVDPTGRNAAVYRSLT